MRHSRGGLAVLALIALVGLSGCGGGHPAAAPAPTRLTGLFKLAPGRCTSATAKPTGSYLIVISASQNKAVRNSRGGCVNKNFTVLRPGTDGGLITGRFQAAPTPLFDARRNSRAGAIIKPVRFGPFRLGFATDAHDEQDAVGSAPAYVAPIATVSGKALTVDLRSLVISYGGQPNSTCASGYGIGCWELGSRSASGSYDPITHRFVIDWFTGESFTPKGDSIEVRLAGRFVPSA